MPLSFVETSIAPFFVSPSRYPCISPLETLGLKLIPELLNGPEIDEQIEINSHYRGYLKKQKADILAFKRDENLMIPDNIDYDQFSGLSNEVKAKFKKIKPKTMGQALRIDGITPAAVYILLSHVKRKSIKHIA